MIKDQLPEFHRDKSILHSQDHNCASQTNQTWRKLLLEKDYFGQYTIHPGQQKCTRMWRKVSVEWDETWHNTTCANLSYLSESQSKTIKSSRSPTTITGIEMEIGMNYYEFCY